jgi:hypothetical protein
MPVNIAAKLVENAALGALAAAKKPFECIRQVSMAGVNTALDVGGYHEVSVGAVKFNTGDGGEIPDKKYVDVPVSQSTAVADRCVAAIMQQAREGHVPTDPLHEAMTVYKVTYPVLSEQIPNPGVSTNYVVTSPSLPNTLRMKLDDACPGKCPCPMSNKKQPRVVNKQPKKTWAQRRGHGDEPPDLVGSDYESDSDEERELFRARHPGGVVKEDDDDDDEPEETEMFLGGQEGEFLRRRLQEAYDHLGVLPEASQLPREPLLRTRVFDADLEPIDPIDQHILGPKEFEQKSREMSNALRYNEHLPRDDVGAVHNEILADELGCTTDVVDQVVWSSQGTHDLRFERIEYGGLVTIRAKYKNKSFGLGPEFMNTEYGKEAARNVVLPDANGTSKNTLGIFNDLYPGEKFTFAFEKDGADHCPVFRVKIQYRVFVGEGAASTLQQSKSSAMGDLLAKMLTPSNENLDYAIVMTNREKKIFRAYNCIGKYKPDNELLQMVLTQLRRKSDMTSKEIARALGVTVKSVNQVCYHNTDKFNRTCSGWELSTGVRGPVFKKVFGSSATASVLGSITELREIVEFHIQVPARYAELALSMTAGNTGVSNISYVGTRFRSVLSDDDTIPRSDVDVYTNALTLLAFITRNSSTIPYATVNVDHKGSAFLDICIDASLTIDEKFAMLEKEKRSRSGMHVLASYDATNFSGDFEGVRTVVYKNPNSTKDVDKPEASYRCAQVAPNYFGLAGPLDPTSPTTWFSALMRNMSDGEKELCEGVKSVIAKHALKGKAKENYLAAIKIIAEGDVKCFQKLVKEGKIGSDCQKPPARFTEEKAAELYNIYSDWYDRVGADKANHRMYVLLGLIEKTMPEGMATFPKGGEVDDRGRLIQPTTWNEGHTVCDGNVVKVIAETCKQSRPSSSFKGLTENGKKCFFGKFRELAYQLGAALHCFDRSKQDWLTSLLLLECYEDYMSAVSEAMLKAGFDKVANTMYSSKNKATKCTTDEFVIVTEHAWAMLTSACAQTSDANRVKTEVEFLVYLLDNGWTLRECQQVYDSWNNPAHRDIVIDCDGNEVAVPNSKMVFPIKLEGDDTTTMDKWGTFERNNTAHCVKFAAFNKKYASSWIPSSAAHDHEPLSPIDTLSVLYFSDNDRDRQNQSTKLPSGRPDFAIPHPVKKAQSLVAMWSPANIKFQTESDGTVNCILDDPTRIAIVTAKVSQAETMRDLLWLRREATQSAQYFLKEHTSSEYMSTAGPIWDPRDPEARDVAPSYEQPVVQRLVEVDSSMPHAESSKELLIANAEAWRLTCPELRAVSVATLAAELVVLDVHVDEEGITKQDFDIRHSFQRVCSLAPNIAKVCEKNVAKTVGRFNTLGGEGTIQRLEQQKEAVGLLLSVGGKRRTYEEAVTNEQSSLRRGSYWRNQGSNGGQRRGASDSSQSWESCANRAHSGGSPNWGSW